MSDVRDIFWRESENENDCIDCSVILGFIMMLCGNCRLKVADVPLPLMCMAWEQLSLVADVPLPLMRTVWEQLSSVADVPTISCMVWEQLIISS